MARITLNIPDNRIARVRAAFAVRFGYRPEIATTVYDPPSPETPYSQPRTVTAPNPETIDAFIVRTIAEWAMGIVEEQEFQTDVRVVQRRKDIQIT